MLRMSTGFQSVSTKRLPGLHLAKIGVRLTRLSREQADYIGVSPEGPYKPEHYRY